MGASDRYANAASALLVRQGDAQAQAQAATGQLWADTTTQLGNLASGTVQHVQAQQAAAQDEATVRALFANGTPSANEIIRTLGPERGIKIINGLAALKYDAGGDYEKQQKLIQNTMLGLQALPPEMRAEAYPGIRENLVRRKLVPDDESVMPRAYSEPWLTQAVNFGKEPKAPTERGYTLGPGQHRFDDATNQEVASVAAPEPKEPKPAESAKLGSFEDYVQRYAVGKGKTAEQLTPADIEDARKRFLTADDHPRVDVRVNDQSQNDVKETIQGMKDGTLPPIMPGRATKEYNALLAEAHRQKFDLSAAATDWAATQKHIASLNGNQQLRLNQAINQLPDLLDSIDTLAGKWNAGRFPPLNRAQLALAKNGALGRDAATIATQLEAQIADVTSDLGAVYMGGNSPTDHALGLAAKALSADWDAKVLKDMTALARSNVRTRLNSIRSTGVQGASPNNPYAPAQTAPSPSGRYNPVTGQVEPINAR